MNRIYRQIRFMFLLVLAASGIAKAQQNYGYPPAEIIELITDRSLYITGEKVNFSAYYVLTDEAQREPLSRILYAEIVSPDVQQVTGGKFPLADYTSNGFLIIPKDIVTGFYYLRVYTKYMRNLGPGHYTYVGLKIINPYKTDVLEGKDTLWNHTDLKNHQMGSECLGITLDKKAYHTRDTVKVLINEKARSANELQNLAVSVVPSGASFTYSLPVNSSAKNITGLDYYPETRGLSLSGTLEDMTNRKVLVNTRINLSIIGEGRDFMAIETDSTGRFNLPLPSYTGARDLFLCTKNIPGIQAGILVDNDFCTLPYQLPSPIFKLTEEERKVATQMAANARINDWFDKDKPAQTTADNINNRPFYGSPTGTLVFDNFIELPMLEEYFNELPTQVKVRRKDGEPYFKVIGSQPEMLFYDPLVLVDRVAVDDPVKVLAISPKDISRIEVVNEPYIKGNITYGGIVSIISKHGDFASIDLPESGIFIHYNFLENITTTIHNPLISKNKPDARNTVYWEPVLQINKDGNTEFSFSTPDTPGEFEVIVSGMNRNGEILIQKTIFEVLQ